ncbi:MAG: U32 family peptidase [Bacillus subtilis]|nr:U32 family peptidase [Bacillus subtilis]
MVDFYIETIFLPEDEVLLAIEVYAGLATSQHFFARSMTPYDHGFYDRPTAAKGGVAMNRPELLAPAGDLEKLKIALVYGADAVYLGGTSYSLRARASKFTLPMIAEGVAFAHARGKKVYVTTNMIPHNDDLPGLDDYLINLEAIGVDALICSSPVVIAAP